MRNLICNIIIIVAILSFQSCLKEEKDIFGESSAQRLIDAEKKYKELLRSAENGWIMDYYAGTDEDIMGGYQILCKFGDNKATLAGAFTMGDYKTVGQIQESSYRLLQMQGPCLSFSTYNPVLHPFADPGSVSDPYGYAGDFEFVITKATKDKIEMRGIKHDLHIVMRPMAEDKSWEKYCSDVVELENILSTFNRFEVKRAGQHAGYLTMWPGDSEMHDTERNDIQITNYAPNDEGIILYDSLTIGGNIIKRLNWNKEESKFVGYEENSDLELVPLFLNSEKLEGDYLASSDLISTPYPVKLTDKGDGKTLRVSKEFLKAYNEDLDYEFDIEVYENNQLGIKNQVLHTDPNTKHTTRLTVVTKTNILFGTSVGYNTVHPYSGSWYRSTPEKPELRFLPTVVKSLFLPLNVVGIRIITYSNQSSTGSTNVVAFKTVIITNPILTKQ